MSQYKDQLRAARGSLERTVRLDSDNSYLYTNWEYVPEKSTP
jgi:hypothetical protein